MGQAAGGSHSTVANVGGENLKGSLRAVSDERSGQLMSLGRSIRSLPTMLVPDDLVAEMIFTLLQETLEAPSRQRTPFVLGLQRCYDLQTKFVFPLVTCLRSDARLVCNYTTELKVVREIPSAAFQNMYDMDVTFTGTANDMLAGILRLESR